MEPTLSMHVCTFEKDQNDKLSSALCSYAIDQKLPKVTFQLTFPLNEYRNMSRKDAEFVNWLRHQTQLLEVSFTRKIPGFSTVESLEVGTNSEIKRMSSSEVCDDLIIDFEIVVR